MKIPDGWAIRIAFFIVFLIPAMHATEDVPIADGVFAPGYETLLRKDPVLLRDGGAKILESDGCRYFISVGVTSILGVGAAERIRQLRVARIQALREAVSFAEATHVSTKDEMNETTKIQNANGKKTVSSTLTLDESTIATIKAIIKSPQDIGSWKSVDGQLFFYAVGTKLE